MTTVTIYNKPGCHLCDVAREIVGTVLADYPDDVVELREIDILGDESLAAEYGEKIPVVAIDDAVHSIWRVDAGRFRAAVDGALVVGG